MNKPASIKVPHVVEVVSIGEERGVVLPKVLLAKLGVDAGGKLDVVEGPDGLALRRHDADFARQMKAMREVMDRRAVALRELAK